MKKIDFEHGGIAENILMAAFPMLIAQVLSLLYSIVDRIYIGRIPGAGTAALGAVGLCFPIIMIISGFTNLYGMGGAPLYSMELGRGNLEKARQYQNTSFRFLVITAVVITLACELFGRKLLALFGATAAEIPDAHAYLQIYAAGTIFFMISSEASVSYSILQIICFIVSSFPGTLSSCGIILTKNEGKSKDDRQANYACGVFSFPESSDIVDV